MDRRFDILYRFSTDGGTTWVDFSDQVDSLRTSITMNLCTNNFISAKDEASVTLPETKLYYPDNSPTPKKKLIDAILGNNPVLVHINETEPAVQVLWDDNDVLWDGNHVMWSDTARRFTGYVDKSSVSLRSYPLPPLLTIRLQDVSVLHLDDKVNTMICWEDYTIKQIVRGLLSLAGYDTSHPSLSDSDTTVMSSTDNVSLEAFVVDKDKAKTYRQYIDTILFEAGGYVLDFDEYGTPVLTHLQWDGSVASNRTIDNPMNADGVSMRTAYLVNDGAKVKWSTLAWAENERIWMSNTQPKYEDGVAVGDVVHDQGYWPNGGDVSPVYFQYDAKLLDTPYLHSETRWQNEDLSIIMAKNTRLGVDALKGTSAFPISSWDKHDPTTWPSGDTWQDKYGLDSNPQYWPTKMWVLLQNKSGADVNVSLAYIYGDVLYRNRVNTIQTSDSKNPKEYTSEYIYDKDQAERFLQFYWHFLQTSRYQFTWSEPNVYDRLNDVVSVGIKGNGSYQKALIVGKTSKWLNAKTEVQTFTTVAIEVYSAATLIPAAIAPSSTNTYVPSTKSAVTATFSSTPTFTLAEWENFANAQQEWTVTNPSAFSEGDVALIKGYISDMDNLPIKLYMNVNDITGSVISGVGIRIEYTPLQYQWDFSMSATEAIRQDRDTLGGIYTDIVCESCELGYGLLPYWKILNGSPSLVYFVNNNSQTNTGDKVTVRIWAQNTEDKIVIRMASDNSNNPSYKIEKAIAIKNVTEYNHDFGAWEPTGAFLLPDHITVDGVDYDIISGDFFVAKTTFATASSGTVTAVGTENPHNLGWMERLGSGTSADPYYYVLTSDTSCSAGDSYYTANSGDTYTEGVPYEYIYPAWHNEISATTENADRMLRSLANVLNDGGIQPSTAAIYGWFKNLTALNAVIKHLTVGNLTIDKVMSNGKRFQFIAHAYDSNGALLAIPEYDIIYDGTKMFSVDTEHGEISIDGNFKSNGFATSKSSSSTIPVTMSASQLTEYYMISRWADPVWAFAFRTGHTSFTLTSAQRNGMLAAGMPQSLISSVGATWYRQSSVTGTFRGQSFSGVNGPGSSSRSMTAYLCAVIYSGQLWIGQCDDGVTYGYDDGWNTADLGYHDFIYAPMPESSSATFEGETVVSSGYTFGYLLPSSYLTNKISAYNLPTGTDLEIESNTSGTISINGTTLDPATTDVYLNITATSLRIFNTTHNDYSDILNDASFDADRFYQATDFAISNIDISTTKDGIKTMHIVPYADEQYDIGLSTNKYKNIYAEKVYGAVFN